jgi:hypothetical protein
MDPKRLKLGQQDLVPKKTNRAKAPRHKPGEKFLKGPVPLNWLSRAGQLPGKSLHVGVVLWFLAGMCRTNSVALSNGVLRLFGVDRHAKYRALNCLEQDGLIEQEQNTGRSPIVTLVAVGEVDEEA